MNAFPLLTLSCLVSLLVGCNASLHNVRSTALSDTKQAPTGVPWVESKRYDVYIYQGATAGGQLLFHDRVALGDKLNGKVIDNKREKWEINYEAGALSDGSMEIEFHANGSLKKATVTAHPQSAAAAETAAAALNAQDEIEKKELERLKRKQELREVKDALNKKPGAE